MGQGRNLWAGLLALLFSCLVGCGGGPGEAPMVVCAAPSQTCNGICTDTQTSHEHCGVCGQACAADAECKSGACVTSCPTPCAAGSECIGGTCVASCLLSQERCAGTCVDIQSSALHCGACDSPCQGSCIEGVCKAPCQGAECQCQVGQTPCAGACVDLTTDSKNCGGCGQLCMDDQTCQTGDCVCQAGLSACSGSCVDTKTSLAHCGACGKSCALHQSCVLGNCECDGERELCDGACVDLETDSAHCGTCDQACAEGQACVDGGCIAAANDDCGGPAEDAVVTRLALYQVVEIDLYRDGTPLSSPVRKAPVVAGRAALIRGFIEPGAGFQPRELSLRLRLESESGERVLHHRRMVSGASSQSNLTSTFQIEVPADAIDTTTTYSVELVSCEAASEPTGSPQRIPETGSIMLDAQDTGIVKVAFVPLVHDGFIPDTSTATLERYVAEVRRQYPIVDIEYTVTDPVPSGATGTNFYFGNVLETVVIKRDADNPPADVYYYGLIKPTSSFRQFCNGSCTTGVAYLVQGAGPSNAPARSGLGIGFDDQASHATFPHELGHNHGRDHAPCGVQGDPNFPYQDALIGSWGYDNVSQSLKSPMEFWDFMSYCSPNWVSDYTYNALATRIAQVNSVANSRIVETGPKQTFRGILSTPSGVRWTRSIVAVTPPGTPEVAVVYDEQGQAVTEVDAFRLEMSEDAGFVLYVPSPLPGWAKVGPIGGPVLAY